jgi:hypothetical protein
MRALGYLFAFVLLLLIGSAASAQDRAKGFLGIELKDITKEEPLMSQVKHKARGYPVPTRTGMKLGVPMDRAEERAGPEDVGQQALMRGLDTAFPFFRLGLSRSEIGRRSDDRPHRFPQEFPCRGLALTTARLI